MKIFLYTPFFQSNNPERQAEFDACLKGNLENPFIDRIFLFIDDGIIPNFRNDKIRIVHIKSRLTYRDWLEFTAEQTTDHISVLANTDILFDRTITYLDEALRGENRFVALSRHEKQGEALNPHPNPKWSQDVWAIRSSEKIPLPLLKETDFQLGIPRCDNKIVYSFAVHGWQMINPFPTIQAIHLHESQIRNYEKEKDRSIIGGMGFISAEAGLESESVVELSVWPRKASHISNLRLIDALEVWDKQAEATPVPKDSRIVAYNQDWQFPAITEKCAYTNILKKKSLIARDCTYLAFPWATLIDKLGNNPEDSQKLLSALEALIPKSTGKRRIITTCQHIRMLQFIKYFKKVGITDIFWSHAVKGQPIAPTEPEIRIHPFPLYPVQTAELNTVDNDRNVLFSFIGAYARDFYLTRVRDFILDELANDPRGVVVGRSDWHYNKVVYDHQIKGNAEPKEKLVDQDASTEFKTVLARSIFSLCPSGSGPNSIRLWESIGAGAIPVILADTHALPGNQELWEQAVVFCDETKSAVVALPEKLEKIAQDTAKLAEKRQALQQLWMLYGPQNFTYDIESYFLDLNTRPSVDTSTPLPLADEELMLVAQSVLKKNGDNKNEQDFLLTTCASRALLQPGNFSLIYEQSPDLRHALHKASKNRTGSPSAIAWEKAPRVGVAQRINGAAGKSKKRTIVRLGRNSHRMPLAYVAYADLFTQRMNVSGIIEDADFIALGASPNIRENIETIAEVKKRKPNVRICVMSEEPLWDTTWGDEFGEKNCNISWQGTTIEYTALNHMTSPIFAFDKLPYFITTENHYFVRYANLFKRNAELTPSEILTVWNNARWKFAFFAERREEPRYDFSRPNEDLYGLSAYRTRIADGFSGNDALRCGKGWNETGPRQALPDWHLDKLASLDGNSFVVSGLENTHQQHYITEKIFDAFACLGVPLYFASPNHRVHDLVPSDTFINLFGLKSDDAIAKVKNFTPDLAFAEAYLETQKRLSKLFSDPQTLIKERNRVVDETVAALIKL